MQAFSWFGLLLVAELDYKRVIICVSLAKGYTKRCLWWLRWGRVPKYLFKHDSECICFWMR